MIGLIEVSMVSWALLMAATWIIVALFAPSRLDPTLPPLHRSAHARMWLHAPLWLPSLVVALSVGAGPVGALLGYPDHCLVHPDHHHHLCALHPPHTSNHLLAWIIAGAVLVPLTAFLARAARSRLHESRLATSLVRISRPSPWGNEIRLLDRSEPIALTVGFRRPVVLLSTGLLETVSPSAIGIIVAHEQAHVRRRDTTWAVVDSFAATLLPRTVRLGLLRELSLAREQACDRAAAERNGTVPVAAALVEVARLAFARTGFGVSIAASSIEARVRHLLDTPAPQRRGAWATGAALLAIAALGLGPVHNLIERFVTLLLH